MIMLTDPNNVSFQKISIPPPQRVGGNSEGLGPERVGENSEGWGVSKQLQYFPRGKGLQKDFNFQKVSKCSKFNMQIFFLS